MKAGAWVAVMALSALAAVSAGAEEGALPKAASARVSAFVEKNPVAPGERTRFWVEVDAERDARVEVSSEGARFGGLRVIEFGEAPGIKSGDKTRRIRKWYAVEPPIEGAFVIEPFAVEVTREGRTISLQAPKVFLEAKSPEVSADAKEEGLRDIKGEVDLAPDWSPVWKWGVPALLAVGGIMAAWFVVRRRSASKPKPPKPAHIRAFEELDSLERDTDINFRKSKEFYYRVSGCLRRYIEDRFGIRAPEQTTEEFLSQAAHSTAIDARWITVLKQYLQECDLVKYADCEPAPEWAGRVLAITRDFVRETAILEEAGPERGAAK